MARFTPLLQTILQKKLDRGMPRDRAFIDVRKDNHRSIAEWYEHVESIVERFDGDPPAEWQGVIGKVREAIALERELLKDLDELEESGWATAK